MQRLNANVELQKGVKNFRLLKQTALALWHNIHCPELFQQGDTEDGARGDAAHQWRHNTNPLASVQQQPIISYSLQRRRRRPVHRYEIAHKDRNSAVLLTDAGLKPNSTRAYSISVQVVR